MEKTNIFETDPVEIYKLRLNGKIKTFPYNYFNKYICGNVAIKRATAITKFLISDIMNLEMSEIPKKLNAYTFNRYLLNTMLKDAFSGDVFEAVDTLYPGVFSRYEFIRSKNEINQKVAIDATFWFIEEVLKINLEKSGKLLSKALFKKHNLNWLLSYYNGSIYDVINSAYPGKYMQWHFTCPKRFWTRENATKAMRWLIEEKCEGILSNFTPQLVLDTNLSYPFSKFFSSDLFKVVNILYPKKYTKKDFLKFVTNTEKIRNAFSSILKNPSKFLFYKGISATYFKEHGLSKELKYFKNDVYAAISMSFPEYSFKPWQFNCKKNFWNEETAIELTKWLIEKEMIEKGIKNISEVSPKIYYKNGVGEVLKKIYNKNPYAAFHAAYPEIFK